MKRRKLNLALTLMITFALMAFVVIYTGSLIYKISVANIYEVGEDKIEGTAAALENYLNTAQSVLWVTADSVEHMVGRGDGNERILNYLLEESANQAAQFDENYTGIYGLVQGEYLDGVGWEPPDDYDPTTRDWYISARKANGEMTIVSPYVDAQTGAVIISISKMLGNGEDVLSLDVTMNYIQSYIEKITLNDMGYGFLVNEDGIIIAHHDNSLAGKNCYDLDEGDIFMDRIISEREGRFNMTIDGKGHTVFVHPVLNQWYAVIVVEDDTLLADVREQLVISVLVFVVCFFLIALFYLIAYRNEQIYSRNMEDLKIREQKKEYEAQVLKVEKSAADSANKAKSTFLAEMSHEIRTPINAVLGMNEMILRESGEENIREYAENVQSAGRTLLSLINSILDFSKIEDGKMELTYVTYDLAGLIHDLVNSISERAAGKNLTFSVHVDESLPSRLVGDDVRIRQIIMNLLSNAVKYTETGSVDLYFKDNSREDDCVILEVSVKDTGIGIRDEDREKLFASFQRLDETRNRHIEGTGLGMAIVTKLLQMMNSELKVESVYGEGSCFSFCLKQEIAEETPIGDYSAKMANAHNPHLDSTHLYAPEARILVVDDNEMNLKVVRSLMKLNGIVPRLVTSGREAIDCLKEESYQVILLDHMMPGMDGVETLKIMKEENLLPEGCTVIALTANAVVGAREGYLSAGFDDYLSKPIEVEQMEALLEKYLPSDIVSRVENSEVQTKVPAGQTASREEEEILEFLPGGDMEKLKEAGGNLIDLAVKAGLNTESALLYCGSDRGFYEELLGDFSTEQEEKEKRLSGYFEAKDWKEYRTLVHSLKSSAKTIGAAALSESAKELEDASAREDVAFIEGHHEQFCRDYRELAGQLRTDK
ncbi:MAG: response regulator [Lachnospiraceae bacterium]|nr:response regulator [Lachnospiraceae bacterium]